MPSNSLVRQLLGESKTRVPVKERSLVEKLTGVTEGTINIHIHNGKDDEKQVVKAEDVPELELPDDIEPEPQGGDRPPMPPPQINSPGAKNYVFKVKRDAQGRVAEIYATKLS